MLVSVCSCDPGPSLDSDELWESEVGGEDALRLTSFLSRSGQVSDMYMDRYTRPDHPEG